jgi:hypothetical protein
MVEPEVPVRTRGPGGLGWRAKRISREVGLARNSARHLQGREVDRDGVCKGIR